MRNVILYIAMSLDGFIARETGAIDWLDPAASSMKTDLQYRSMYQRIDTVLLGKKTYDQITQELSPQHWLYEDRHTLVFTHTPCENTSNVTFVQEDPVLVVKNLKQQDGKDIWLNGGASLVHPLLLEGLIDELQIAILPISLGHGIPLFPKEERSYTLSQLISDGDVMLATYHLAL